METNLREIVARYEDASISEDRLVVECLLRIDPRNPANVLRHLAPELIARTLSHTRQLNPGASILFNHGTAPTMAQIVAARKWIEEQAINENSLKHPELNERRGDPVVDPGPFTEAELLDMERAGITLGDAIEQIERLHS